MNLSGFGQSTQKIPEDRALGISPGASGPRQRGFTSLLFAFYFSLILLSGCAATAPARSEGEFIWPPPPEKARIKWLTQWSNRNDFGRQNQLLSTLVGDEKVERLRRSNGVVADNAGNVYVADSELKKVFVFDQEKNSLRFLGEGTLSVPVGLAIDNTRGVLFVSDSKSAKVYGIDKSSDKVVLGLGAPGEFKNPTGLVYDEERGRLYVSDTKAHLVKTYDRDGKFLFDIGKRGVEDGEFNFPSYLALDKAGRLYVVDSFNFRVQTFGSDGKFIKKFGSLGDVSGTFTRPHGIGIDSEGHIYVVDSSFNNFQIFDEDGRLLLWIGNVGGKPGEFYLPTGMYIDRQDRIYVSDTFNRRVQVFQYLKEGK